MSWKLEKTVRWLGENYVIAVDEDGRRGLVDSPSLSEVSGASSFWWVAQPVEDTRVTPMEEVEGDIGGALRILLEPNLATLNQASQLGKTFMVYNPGFRFNGQATAKDVNVGLNQLRDTTSEN